MNTSFSFISLLFNTYQVDEKMTAFMIILVFAIPLYAIYRLIVWKMSDRIKMVFHKFLKIIGISAYVFFFAEITVTIITICNVNKQLGFNYATPETPEGELFLITKVVPGKTMAEAGLEPDDQVQMWGTSELYRLLIDNQGKVVEFLVLRDKNKILIRVKVPVMNLPLRDISFWF